LKLLILSVDDTILKHIFSWPVRELGAVAEVYAGDDPNEPPTRAIKTHIARHQPDVVAISGVCEGPKVVPVQCAKWIRDHCRSVHVCWDAADPPWHPWLKAYKEAGCFDLCIAADGSEHEAVDLSLPTPVDPAYYEDWDKHERTVQLGFSGSIGEGSPRQHTLRQLEGLVTVQRRDHIHHPYGRNADFYKRCWAAVNDANTTFRRLHMKARVVEAALAGCLLFETYGSPTSKWLTPGEEYIEYTNTNEIREFRLPQFHETCKQFGQRARAKMLQHGPAEFWAAVTGNKGEQRWNSVIKESKPVTT
jgi:hypothetical protein